MYAAHYIFMLIRDTRDPRDSYHQSYVRPSCFACLLYLDSDRPFHINASFCRCMLLMVRDQREPDCPSTLLLPPSMISSCVVMSVTVMRFIAHCLFLAPRCIFIIAWLICRSLPVAAPYLHTFTLLEVGGCCRSYAFRDPQPSINDTII